MKLLLKTFDHFVSSQVLGLAFSFCFVLQLANGTFSGLFAAMLCWQKYL